VSLAAGSQTPSALNQRLDVNTDRGFTLISCQIKPVHLLLEFAAREFSSSVYVFFVTKRSLLDDRDVLASVIVDSSEPSILELPSTHARDRSREGSNVTYASFGIAQEAS
jgi:hypothetical protein